ncbi:glutamine-dependent NAD(+) synthetase [Lithohypha guttulata]|nr:glutamine-dependent NAD(+) synthetase [Lithohypha guttulata]
MGRLMTLATCSLNQWAMDFSGNKARIIESIKRAKSAGATLRVGPELEITGYGCLDHFLEGDTFLHSWEMMAQIIEDPICQDIVCDVGIPVRHRNVRYNCRVIFYNKKILLIRPKQFLANDGNYREMRYFTPWSKERYLEDYYLEETVRNITGQRVVPFGDAIISTLDTAFAAETCEELFTSNAPHIHQGLDGCEIFTNSSGSHFEIRKIMTRLTLMTEATRLSKGVYLYSNQKGCDGDRIYYDGCSMIIVNGKCVAQGSQFSLDDVEVVTATVDIEEVRSARFAPSRGIQAQNQQPYPRIEADVALSEPKSGPSPIDLGPSEPISIQAHSPPEEIALCPALWLWDYLRRVGVAGFFIPLSGGIDSCATSVIVFSMCRLVHQAVHSTTIHPATKSQVIADCLDALTALFTTVTSFTPRFRLHGGSPAENLALQNIQARLRMVIAYLWAQLLPTVRQRPGGGALLVLGSANVDEQLRGYLTKYDCSSADINPIGGISKTDLKSFIAYASKAFDLPVLDEFLDATPTAELEPITESYVQSDEADMGMTYAELSVFGRLRKVYKLGPWGMYERLLYSWGKPVPEDQKSMAEGKEGKGVDAVGQQTVGSTPESADASHLINPRGLSPREIRDKVLRFFHFFQINRHKATILPPGLHLEEYSPEDNRFDLRPFLYPSVWTGWAAGKIDRHVKELEEKKTR